MPATADARHSWSEAAAYRCCEPVGARLEETRGVRRPQLADVLRRFGVRPGAGSLLGAGRSASRPVTYLWSTLVIRFWCGTPAASALTGMSLRSPEDRR